MKKCLLVVTAVLGAMLLKAQSGELYTTPPVDGACYMARLEYVNDEPERKAKVYITKRTQADIRTYGGEDYLIDVVGQNTAYPRDLWGVLAGDSLYINTEPVSGSRGYARAESAGKYILMFIAIPTNKAYRLRLEVSDQVNAMLKAQLDRVMKGEAGTGGVMGSGELAEMRLAVFCDRDSGMFRCLSQKHVDALLAANPATAKKYAKPKFASMDRGAVVALFDSLNREHGAAK